MKRFVRIGIDVKDWAVETAIYRVSVKKQEIMRGAGAPHSQDYCHDEQIAQYPIINNISNLQLTLYSSSVSLLK